MTARLPVSKPSDLENASGTFVIDASGHDVPLEIVKDGTVYMHVVLQESGTVKGVGFFGSYFALQNLFTQINPQMRFSNSGGGVGDTYGSIEACDYTNAAVKHQMRLKPSGELWLWPTNGDPVRVMNDVALQPEVDGEGSLGTATLDRSGGMLSGSRWGSAYINKLHVGSVAGGSALAPTMTNLVDVGDAAHGFKSAILHNGSSEYRVTVDSAGALVATKIAANYLTGPSFELKNGVAPSVGATGMPDGWVSGDVGLAGAAPVRTFVTGRTKGLALRTQYTGAPTDNSHTVGILSATGMPAGTVIPGDVITLSGYVKGSNAYAILSYVLYWYNAGGSVISSSASGTLAVTGSWVQQSWTATAPAGTCFVSAMPSLYIWHAGATIDVSMDDFMLEKAASPSAYFDGSYGSDCLWANLPNASTSRKG